ncbi:MAG: Gfo/Idh/MocA family oxidoreductase [Pirellulaceae bacterium]|nr:Gfo/Idh/MocA family oxidoreductase [Planctomycetales bacterium]
MKLRANRRKFMQTTAAVGVGFWATGSLKPVRAQDANSQVQIACVGVGGKGDSDSSDAGRLAKVVGICDIDERNLNKKANNYPDAKKFVDFREMFAELGDKFDAVTVSTPDHNHALVSISAMMLGKHCFCQKPLTHDIWEARMMGEVARKQGVITQMGNQGTAHDGLRRAAKFLQQGGLGTVREVHVWTNRPIWPQGNERPKEEQEVPPHIHWDQWLGTAPFRPFHAETYHPFNWRGYWDFGTGALGDMACHTFNMPFMGLELRDPTSVQARTSGHNGDTYPGWSVIDFEFPARGDRAALKMTWYDGGERPGTDILGDIKPADSGLMIIGSEGKLYSPNDYGAEYDLIGVEEPKDIEFNKSPGHFNEFIMGIKGEYKPVSNFPDYAGPLTETILLGNLAVWSGKRVNWDAQGLKAENAPELDKIIHREYRDGFSVDEALMAHA